MKLWETLLQLHFDNITEYDPDLVFDTNVIFSAFCSFYETYLHISVDKKTMLEAGIKLCFCLNVEGLMHVQILIKQNILEVMKL